MAGVIGGVGSAGALCGTFLSNDLYAVAAAFAVVAVLVLTGWFGLAEMRLIRSRATATYQTVRGNRNSVEMSVQLQGSAEWKDLWGRLVTLSKALQVHSLHLDVNAPAWHESFHARWDRSDSGVFSLAVHFWRVDLPVYAREMAVGKMTIVGAADRLPMVEQLFQLTEILAEVPQILPPLARSAPVVTGAPAPGVPANGMVPRTASV